jgi:glycosyltransferase involved in cell wall biosynthesis
MDSIDSQYKDGVTTQAFAADPSLSSLGPAMVADPARIGLSSASTIETAVDRLPRELLFGGTFEVARQASAAEAGSIWQSTTANYVAWLQPGDELIPEMVERVLERFEAQPDCDVIYASARLVDSQGAELDIFHPRTPTPKLLQRRFCLLPAATFVRKSAIERFGTLDGSWHYWAAYEFWTRLAESGAKFQQFDSVVATRAMTPGNPLLSLAELDELPLACDELTSLLRTRYDSINSSWALWMGRACACAERLNRGSSLAYDRAVLGRALEAVSNSSPRQLAALRVRVRHFGSELLVLLRRPGLAKRLLKHSDQPSWLSQRLKEFRSPNLFCLYRYPARPAKTELQPKQPNARPRKSLGLLPQIALVTPNYNCGKYIERTIQSIVEQGYPNLVYHVQDGGSNDSSLGVIRNYSERVSSWESVKDRGQSHAINLGFQRVTGDVMGWLNSDDILLPRALDRVGKFFARHPDIGVVYGHRLLIDSEDRVINRWVLPAHDHRMIQWADYIPQETMFWRRSLWEQVGGMINEQFQFAMDWELILRFRRAGAKFYRLPYLLAAFRITDQQKTSQLLASVGRRESNLLRRQELGFIPSDEEISKQLKSYTRRHWWAEKLYAVQERVGLRERY